ncbi:MAG: DUF4149 domain-containing protein [Acidobacteria bacterium]|nr:MAG: DUF4149 domain-containing protein [Acidobacteriota bacterium]
MTATLRFVHLLGLVVWIGGVVFFSFVTAPTLFGSLPRDMAGRAVSAIFPRYYLLGWIGGSLSLLSALVLGLRAAAWPRALVAELALLLLMLGLSLFAGQVILPQAYALRLSLPGLEGTPAYAAAKAEFDRLHRRSVLLNGTVLILGLGAVAIVSIRPPG